MDGEPSAQKTEIVVKNPKVRVLERRRDTTKVTEMENETNVFAAQRRTKRLDGGYVLYT